jgi:hypothetical protein
LPSGVTLLELRIFHCRYIVNEAETVFCGAEVHRVSYCKKHYRLCYVMAKPVTHERVASSQT